ncbi:hypothetical protein F5Y03DRAFT_402948 [Xylaria venustula]|nr:hypothetical protein F5Y03DRAFT_402948 [Xylaria venustula]
MTTSVIKETLMSQLTMLTSQKKGLRARAKTALSGFTIDPKFVQDSFNPNNSNIAARSSRNEVSTFNGFENKNRSRSRAGLRGLTVDTKLARETYQPENSGVGNTRLVRKTNYVESPKLTEAMMNRNWRTPRHTLDERSPDMMESLWSAPPDNSKFLDQTMTKPRRDDEFEMIDYDHGLQRAAYRCRRPDEVRTDLIPFTKPGDINPDPCLSAPATKTEFSVAEIETEERSAKYDPSIFQPSVKSVVRLNEMLPTKRAGYEKILNWDEQHADQKARRRLCDSSSLTIVSLADPSESWETIDFPYAELRAVKGNQKFEMGLSNVEETIRKQLTTLVEPQSAGLPPAYLRKEYEEIKEERRKAMIRARAIGTQGHQSSAAYDRGASTEGVNDSQFNNLLGKLNKLCAPRLRAFTVNDQEDSRGYDRTDGTEHVMKSGLHSPSGDSGISGLSLGGRPRSSTLNPEANEFQLTTREKLPPVTKECESIVSAPATPESVGQTSKQSAGSTDPIRLLETRVAELEAQIAQRESKHVQSARQRRDKGHKTNRASYGAKSSGSPAHGVGIHPGMNRSVSGPAVYPAAYPPMYSQPQPVFPMGVGGVAMNPMPVPGQCALPQNVPGFPPGVMPTGFPGPNNTAQGILPYGGYRAPMPSKPVSGTSLWVKSMFGPKPVSKPDRPFRPGDGVQAVRQQEYEEYLEHLRATDPTYALSCKQRQARRADRQRPGPPYGNGDGQKISC